MVVALAIVAAIGDVGRFEQSQKLVWSCPRLTGHLAMVIELE
jgi:hypothetical protein